MTKEKLAWTGFGLPLAWLADLDKLSAKNAIADAWGDQYLYRYCPIFASIRNSALDLGYLFSADDTPLWRDYQALSLIVLHRIISGKVIPYFDTATTIGRVIDANPGARMPAGFITSNLKRNRVFHESAHCVAHAIMRQIGTELRSIAPVEANRIVLEAILAESFANTVEALGSLFQNMPISDQVFYSLNSSIRHNQKRDDVMNRASAELGSRLRFILLFLSYFEANLSIRPAVDSTHDRIAEGAGCLGDQAGITREIVTIGFHLNDGFREGTTPVYFDLLGYAREYNALANSNWLGLAQNQRFSRAVALLFWEATGEPDSIRPEDRHDSRSA